MWNAEHAHAFTVAKAMQMDVLGDIHTAVTDAIRDGQTFRDFQKRLAPILQAKGWWGKKTMVDPATGEVKPVQLGSRRRLETIYRTNLRSAYAYGKWQRGQASSEHTHILYLNGPSANHREQHQAWHGTLLPKDDPFWNTHFPPNGWGCKCYTRFVTRRTARRLKREGVVNPPRVDGSGGGTTPVTTTRPDIRYRTYHNRRRGTVERLPVGIDPGFAWNPGAGGRDLSIVNTAIRKARDRFPAQLEAVARTILSGEIRTRAYRAFVDDALACHGRGQGRVMAVGFIRDATRWWLRDNAGVDIGERTVVALEERLITGAKAARHARAGDALSNDDWLGLVESLLHARARFDDGNLVYLTEAGIKVVVAPVAKPLAHRGAEIQTPRIVSAYRASSDEINRIRKLPWAE